MIFLVELLWDENVLDGASVHTVCSLVLCSRLDVFFLDGTFFGWNFFRWNLGLAASYCQMELISL